MMTRAQPRGGSARLAPVNDMDVAAQRDVMAITQMRFRPFAARDRFQIRRAVADAAMVAAKRIAGATNASTQGRCRGERLRVGSERRKVAHPVGLRSAAIGLNCVNQGQD